MRDVARGPCGYCGADHWSIDCQLRGGTATGDAEIAALKAELESWRSYYGADDPRDGVVETAVGRIVGEKNREIYTLKAENERLNEALRTVFGLEPHENIVSAEHGSVLVDGKGGDRKRVSPTSDREIALEARIAVALALADGTQGTPQGQRLVEAMAEALKGA